MPPGDYSIHLKVMLFSIKHLDRPLSLIKKGQIAVICP